MDFFAISSLVFIFLQFISLILFVYYVILYSKHHGAQKDLYSIICFLTLILSILCKVILRFISIPLIMKETNDMYRYLALEARDNPTNVLLELYNEAAISSLMLFYIAISANAIRWMYLIRVVITKNY